MNRIWGVIGMATAAMLMMTPVVFAKGLSQAEAEQLVKGNTAEGVNRFGKQMIWYFEPSGTLKKMDHNGNKGKARWNINKQGQMCYQDKQMGKEQCVPIIQKGEGKYELPFDAYWKWNKVVPGNPHNL